MNRNNKNNRGVILLNVLVFSAIAVVVVTFFISWASSSIKIAKLTLYREQAFQIAEAGIDYYRWHLAHNPNDFQDGTGVSGPYSHVFYDKDGNAIGNFILTITPPITGSTIVTIKSEGHVDEYPLVTRTIQVRLAIPSFAKFAIVANDFMRFGEGTEVFGPIHSNSGIRFDGLAHNLITSAAASFNDPDHSWYNEFGVHTHLNTSGVVIDSFRTLEAPTNPVQTRPDVFIAGRQFPVPQADFTGITSDLASIKTNALAGGEHLDPLGSEMKGYHIVLKTDDTYDLYKVISTYTPSYSCRSNSNPSNSDITWGSWSIGSETFMGNFDNPDNGLIFVEDNVWVDGQIDGARITIAAGVFPDNETTRKNIIINKDLLYTNYDGTDVIGLIAQQNITVGMISEDDLRIDAALMAVNGRVGRYYYSSSCNPYHLRDSLTLYGMIGSSKRYGFAYTGVTSSTGYDIRTIIYDANLLYGPPVSFPLTSDKYVTISWEELE